MTLYDPIDIHNDHDYQVRFLSEKHRIAVERVEELEIMNERLISRLVDVDENEMQLEARIQELEKHIAEAETMLDKWQEIAAKHRGRIEELEDKNLQQVLHIDMINARIVELEDDAKPYVEFTALTERITELEGALREIASARLTSRLDAATFQAIARAALRSDSGYPLEDPPVEGYPNPVK